MVARLSIVMEHLVVPCVSKLLFNVFRSFLIPYDVVWYPLLFQLLGIPHPSCARLKFGSSLSYHNHEVSNNKINKYFRANGFTFPYPYLYSNWCHLLCTRHLFLFYWPVSCQDQTDKGKSKNLPVVHIFSGKRSYVSCSTSGFPTHSPFWWIQLKEHRISLQYSDLSFKLHFVNPGRIASLLLDNNDGNRSCHRIRLSRGWSKWVAILNTDVDGLNATFIRPSTEN